MPIYDVHPGLWYDNTSGSYLPFPPYQPYPQPPFIQQPPPQSNPSIQDIVWQIEQSEKALNRRKLRSVKDYTLDSVDAFDFAE